MIRHIRPIPTLSHQSGSVAVRTAPSINVPSVENSAKNKNKMANTATAIPSSCFHHPGIFISLPTPGQPNKHISQNDLFKAHSRFAVKR